MVSALPRAPGTCCAPGRADVGRCTAKVTNADCLLERTGKASPPQAIPCAERTKGKLTAPSRRTPTSQEDCGAAACLETCEFTNEHCDSKVQKCRGEYERAKVQVLAMGQNCGEPLPPDSPTSQPASADEEPIEDIPMDEMLADPLYLAKVSCGLFNGEVEHIEQGTITKERYYRVLYDDGDMEHFTAEEAYNKLRVLCTGQYTIAWH